MKTSDDALKKYRARGNGTALRDQILAVIDKAGSYGATHDDISAHFPESQYHGSVHKRYTELEADSLIFRSGDRTGKATGNKQTLWFHARFADEFGVTLPTSPEPKKTYKQGMRDGIKLILKEVVNELSPEKRKRVRELYEQHREQ